MNPPSLHFARRLRVLVSSFALCGPLAPAVFGADTAPTTRPQETGPKETLLQAKLNRLIIEEVEFRDTPLSDVIEKLSAQALKQDKSGPAITLALLDPQNQNPKVSMLLRGLSLQRILELVCGQAGFDFDVSETEVMVAPVMAPYQPAPITASYPINGAMLDQMGVTGASEKERETSLKLVLDLAGLGFSKNPLSSISLGKEQLVVAHDRQHQKKVSRLLGNLKGSLHKDVEGSLVTEIKLNRVKIAEVNFRGKKLSQVLLTLSQQAKAGDQTKLTAVPGVNLVLMAPKGEDPTINITLRDLSLGRVLEFVCEQAGYEALPEKDVVILRPRSPDSGSIRLTTGFFPMTPNILKRLEIPADSNGKTEAIKNVFESAGVAFANVEGTKLALTGNRLIVTQTQRNLERLDQIMKILAGTAPVEPPPSVRAPTMTLRKSELIKVDHVNFRGMPLSKVVQTLSDMSVKNDMTKLTSKPGLKIVLKNEPTGEDPTVNITLNDLSIQRTLEFICGQVGFQAEYTEDAVIISPK